MADISMPRLSDSMEEGVILEWLVADGTLVTEGEEIVEIETDKTNVAFTAEASGILRHGSVPGDVVAVGARIGAIEETPAGGPAPAPAQTGSIRRPSASPTAARLARRIGVPLESVSGSGRGGRVLRSDVIAVHETARPSVEAAVTTPSDPSAAAAGDRNPHRVPLTRVQRLVAERMATSKSTVPEFTVTRAIDLDAVHRLRGKLRARGETVPSYNDLIVTAVARTLPEHPLLTARYDDGDVVYTHQVNLAVAVATDDVLHAPVIHGADRLGFSGIGRAAGHLRMLARQNRLTIEDLRGGTFTVSNLGMHGVQHFTAIINAGQSAILAVGSVQESMVVADGAFRVGWRAQMTLTCDHRIIYGTHAAAFLRDLDLTLQEPELLQ